MKTVSDKCGILAGNVFHAGDGKLHPNLMLDINNPQQVENVRPGGEKILLLCVEVRGCISGKHRIGVEKLDEKV